MAGSSYELQLFKIPSCYASMQDYLGQPGGDYDKQYKTVLLNFRVRLTGRPPVPDDEPVIYYRRKFSEPLALMTHKRHSSLARDKLSRMLQAVRVPPLACQREYNYDIVGNILNSVRSIAKGLDDPFMPVLRVVVNIKAVLLSLPDVSESDGIGYDDGPVIYLDGPSSRNYEDYSEDEEEVGKNKHVVDVYDLPDYLSFLDLNRKDYLEKLVAAAKGFEKVSVVEEPLDCWICYGEVAVGSQATRLQCSHCFHEHCLINTLKISKFCPLCFQLAA